MATDVETRRSRHDWISKDELRKLMGPEADKYFAQKNHYMMLGKTKVPGKEELEATRRLYTGTSPEKSRDFSKANTVARWYFASLQPDRKRFLRFIEIIEEMLAKGETVTLETLAEKFRGTHIRNTTSSPALLAARRRNIATAREVRKNKARERRKSR